MQDSHFVSLATEQVAVAPSPWPHTEHILQELWSLTSLKVLPLEHDVHTLLLVIVQDEADPSPT